MRFLCRLNIINFLFAWIILVSNLIFSCSEQVRQKPKSGNLSYAKGISSEVFGKIDTAEVTVYTLVNESGMQVRIMNYGATILGILVPDREGNIRDVVL